MHDTQIQTHFRPFEATRFQFGLALLCISLAIWNALPAQAQGPDGYSVYYVTPDGLGGGPDGPTTAVLQYAINMVDDDADVIKVSSGTYTATFDHSGSKDIAYVSRTMTILGGYTPGDWTNRNLSANRPILDPNFEGVAVAVVGGRLTIDGMDLRNGKGVTVSVMSSGNLTMRHCNVSGTMASPLSLSTGAIQTSHRNVEITSCSIINNGTGSSSTYNVMGIYCYYGTAVITSCTVSGNKSHGILCNTVHGARIEGCSVRQNNGNGIRFDYGNNCTVSSNTIEHNEANGIYANKANGLALLNDDIAFNEAHSGAGAYLKDCDNARIDKSLFRQNIASGGDGGGLYMDSSINVALQNSIFVYNECSLIGGGAAFDSYSHGFLAENSWFVGNDSYVDGGGLAIDQSNGTVRNCDFFNNYADQQGGGIDANDNSVVVITGNRFFRNSADTHSGAILAVTNQSIVTSNTIVGNAGRNAAGGLIAGNGTLLENNFFHDNEAIFDGGGLILGVGRLLFKNNTVWRNKCYHAKGTATSGGGVMTTGSDAILINNVIAENWHRVDQNSGGTYGGAGLYAYGSNLQLYHNTIVNNTGGDGSGILIEQNGDEITSITSHANIITSHTIAIRVKDTSTADMKYTLWGGGDWTNHSDWVIVTSGTLSDTAPLTGDPLFTDPDLCDYHIAETSGARDRIPAPSGREILIPGHLTSDIDRQPRPYGSADDAGPDEYAGPHIEVAFPQSATTQTESVATWNIPVTLSAPSNLPVSVNYLVEPVTYDLSFYTDIWTLPGMVTFATGTTTAYIPVRILEDNEGEAPERMRIRIVNPHNARIGANRVFTYTILENDGGIVVSPIAYRNHFIEATMLTGNSFQYGDLNGDRCIDAADRTRRLLLTLGYSPTASPRNGYTATLDIGNASAAPGEVVAIPITLSADTPIAAVHARLTYDPAVLEFDSAIPDYFETGPLVTATHAYSRYAPQPGKFNFWIGDNNTTVTAFAALSGTLCTIRLRIAAGAANGPTEINIRTDETPAPAYPIDACAGVSDLTGNSIPLTRMGGAVTVATAADNVRFHENQACLCESNGAFYAAAWNYATNTWAGTVDTSIAGILTYSLYQDQWIGIFLYDYETGAWPEGMYIYLSDL